MISKIERIIAFRYLKPKKKEGFLKVISIFSFTGIALGVAILIIVMSVMSGFRTELINKILGFNPHIIIKPYEKKIDLKKINDFKEIEKDISRTALTYTGQGILINKKNTICIMIRSYYEDDIYIWDVAAGLSIVEEAGGKIFFKRSNGLYKYNVLASNKYLFNEAKKILIGN